MPEMINIDFIRKNEMPWQLFFKTLGIQQTTSKLLTERTYEFAAAISFIIRAICSKLIDQNFQQLKQVWIILAITKWNYDVSISTNFCEYVGMI